MASNDVPRSDRRRTPKELTPEEIKVLKECRWNSTMRGIPGGILSGAVAHGVKKAGYLTRYPKYLFYGGMIYLGFSIGYGSYSRECTRKIMALKHSALGDRLRAIRKKAGLPLHHNADASGEFQDEFANNVDVRDEEPIDEWDETQSTQTGGKWDEIRRQSRQAQSSALDEKGISYHELRLRNRAQQGDYKSLTPDEEDDLKRRLQNRDLSSGSSALESGLPSFSDDSYINNENESEEREEKKKKTYKKGIPRKNMYGDEIV